MLSLLPQLLFLAPFAATLIRLSLALMLAFEAWVVVSRPSATSRIFALAEVALAAGIFVGAWTQAFALGGAILLLLSLIVPSLRSWPRSTTLLMLVLSLSLVVTGPGAFAFDLPL